MATGIDFMAIARGRQQGLADNWQERLRAEQAAVFDYNAQGRDQQGIVRQQAFDQGQTEQEAAYYLAGLPMAKQNALSKDGVSSADFMMSYIDRLQNDPVFLGKTPETQNAILAKARGTALFDVEALMKQGTPEAVAKANALLQKYGGTSQTSPMNAAVSANDIDKILQLNGLVKDAEGNVNIGGMKVPALQAAYAATTTGGVLAYAAKLQQEQQQQQTQAFKTPAQKLESFNTNYAQLVSSGHVRVGEHEWATKENPTVPVIRLDIEGGIRPLTAPLVGGAAPVVPGAAPVVPGAAPVASPLTPAQQLTAPAVPVAAPAQNDTFARITAALPQAPPAVQQEWQTIVPALQAARTQLTQVEQLKTKLTAEFQAAIAKQDTQTAQSLASRLESIDQAGEALTKQKDDLNSQALALQNKILAKPLLIIGNPVIDDDTNSVLKTIRSPERTAQLLKENPDDTRRMLQKLYTKKAEVLMKLQDIKLKDGARAQYEDFERRIDAAIANFGLK